MKCSESNHFLNLIFHAAIVRFDAFRHIDQLDQPDVPQRVSHKLAARAMLSMIWWKVRCHLLGSTGTGCVESPAHSQHLWPATQDVQNLERVKASSLFHREKRQMHLSEYQCQRGHVFWFAKLHAIWKCNNYDHLTDLPTLRLLWA